MFDNENPLSSNLLLVQANRNWNLSGLTGNNKVLSERKGIKSEIELNGGQVDCCRKKLIDTCFY